VSEAREQIDRARVPPGAKQAGETQGSWSWVEASVWSERMLTALETGVHGGKWFSLIDKVYAHANLESAANQVLANKGAAGVDRVTVRRFRDSLEGELIELREHLRTERYRPQAIRRVWIDKPGSHEQRPLGIPTVRDRVVQTALKNVLEPIFDRDFAEHSYGFRPKRSAKDALRRVWELLQSGAVWVVDADLRSYYDTIPHPELLGRVAAKISDGRVLGLIQALLEQGVMDGCQSWIPEEGTPQGAVLSPLLSNIYLDPLDHLMAQQGFAMVRYADDFVVLCRTAQEADRALAEVQTWTAQAGLKLHPDKTRIVDATQPGGFDFLGYHFEHGRRWPSKKSLRKHKDAIRDLSRRKNGQSLPVIIERINAVRRGWFEYFKHSRKSTFQQLDGWVRMRLRSILRRRQGKQGRGRGSDHRRWPNAFFAKLGLFTCCTALVQARQSSCR